MNLADCSLCRFWNSSIGKKIIVALTGIILVGFLAGHLSGNLLIFVGAEAFNEYAEFLHHMLHGAGVWIARIVLLTTLVLHVAATICLVKENKEAKEKNYECQSTIQATKSSRIMIWSGCTILAFIIFHIAHFTVRFGKLADLGAESPHAMVIEGFSGPGSSIVVIFYVIAMTCLCSHLHHGVASIFQTLGLRTKNNSALINGFARLYTIVIYVGFISIPLAIAFGLVE